MPSIQTVNDLFRAAATRYARRPMLRYKRDGKWQSETCAQWRTESETWARGLIALGLKAGDRIAVLGGTSPAWVKADIAIAMAGGVTVPIYPSLPAHEARFIAADCQARFAFCEDPLSLRKLLDDRDGLPMLERVVCFADHVRWKHPDTEGRTELHVKDLLGADAWAMSAETLAKAGKLKDADVLKKRAALITADQPFTFVYTSGTSGPPKGVILSQAAIVFEIQALVEILDLRDSDSMLLFLPLAHIFERIVCFVSLFRGVELIFPSSLDKLIEELSETRPTIVPSVPRVFETIHKSARARAERAGPVALRTFEWAVRTGVDVARIRHSGERVPTTLMLRYQMARRVVLDKLQDRLGGAVRYCISGGAPLDKHLAEFFAAFGLPILEGYGLTETTAAAAVNRLEDFRLGTVGRALPGTEIAIAADGEVLIRGPHLMKGYHGQPEVTAAVIDADGWFHSGDLGELDEDAFLRITGRKKELIVTASGRNVAPQNIERHMQSHPVISHAVVYGDRQEFLSALITIDEGQLKRWAAEQDVPFTTHAQMSQLPGVYKLVESAIDQKNRGLASYETIKKFAILDREMSTEAGDLTPTMKVRRSAIADKYRALLDSFYSDGY
jgi:long-chain acyl-CoA synthetase